MSLTQADVHNVAFSKPPIGKRGYNEDEVDQFLDLVEDAIAERDERIEHLESQVGKGAGAAETPDADAIRKEISGSYEAKLAELQQQLDAAREKIAHLEGELANAASAQPAPAAAPAPADAPATSDTHMKAARVLGLAQEMADRLTSDAKAEADSLLTDARETAKKLVDDARETATKATEEARAEAERVRTEATTTAETTVSEAQRKADELLTHAKTTSEKTINDAQTQAATELQQAKDKADALQRDAEQKHTEVMATVKEQQEETQRRIDELLTFESEYRNRMKSFLEGQLKELQEQAPHNAGSESAHN